MKFTQVSAAAAALTFAKSALADSDEFYALIIRSASKFHYSGLYVGEDNLVKVGYGHPAVTSVITDDGKLKYGSKYWVALEEGVFRLGEEEEASTGFYASGGHIGVNGSEFYWAATNGSEYILSYKNREEQIQGGNGIVIRGQLAGNNTNATTVRDFHKPNDTDSSTAVTSTLNPAATALVSQIGDGQIQAATSTPVVQAHSLNGANFNGANLFAGAAAAAIGLLM
ncbi:HHR154Cp [Eremothecium sinecaudum]|uniref:HHR154Cp n=1 Tax=Eremothecium sinecaudum TaxID=45286 RepID=A0A109V0W0_9SACH|nr:HHR154Cp [Eremothecium sinecaudum]AMD22923.1 HHR154Cp [Eremothecium sinecaudum]